MPRAIRSTGPRERLAELGCRALADEELIELVLGHGRSGRSADGLARALVRPGGLRTLARREPPDLARTPGIGPAQAARLAAVFEISRRLRGADPARRQAVARPADLAPSLQARYSHEAVECFGVVLLDGRNRYLARHELSRGGWSSSVVRPREVFRQALLAAAPALVLFHNHPSGDPTPSREDLAITGHLRDAGELLGIRVLDHLIVGAEGWISLRERGVL